VRELGVVGKRRSLVTGGFGLGHPELHAVHGPAPSTSGVLGMGDAAPRGHQIQLPRSDRLLVAEAVGVERLALKEPGDRVQPDMRMRPNGHGPVRRDVDRAEAVEEAPRADHTPLTFGE
jgi:hypothetical protein